MAHQADRPEVLVRQPKTTGFWRLRGRVKTAMILSSVEPPLAGRF